MKTKEKLSDLEVVPFTEFNREELFDLIAWAEALVADGVATGDTNMMAAGSVLRADVYAHLGGDDRPLN